MLINFLTKTDVKKNLTISILGVGIGQLIHLLSTPFISRIYTPEQFGQFALFLSIMGVLSSISLMKFDFAIITGEKDDIPKINKLIQKICLFVFIATFILFLLSYFFNDEYKLMLFFCCMAVFAFNRYWTFRAILNRYKKFKELAISKILENIINAASTIVIGLLHFKEIGLFIGKILGLVIASFYLNKKNKTKLLNFKGSLLGTFNKYIKYPKYSFPAELVANFNFNISIFLFTYFFSAIEVGFIGLTSRVLSVPVNFVSISFLDVFKQKADQDYKESNRFNTIYLKFLAVLIIVAIIISSIMFFGGPVLFELVFGKEWYKAGVYAKYIAILYSMRFISTPLSFGFEVTGRNHINLIFQSTYLILGISSIIISYYLTRDDVLCVAAYSFVVSSVYLIHVFLGYLNSKGNRN